METPVQGIQLNGYTLVRLIARGGMGEVYEATEKKLQRRVALKLIAPPNPHEHDQDELVRRFLNEARMLAQLNHPNVVTIFTIDSIGGVPFLAMEYVDGVSFRELLEAFTFSADGAIPLFLQMLEGLKCLHDARILHRDLKPHNILLRADGQVKILDFGIAKNQAGDTDLTKSGIVVGTLPYMSPELKVGVPASVRSDLWSLGAIFYECLTGERLVVALKENVGHRDVPFTTEQQRRIPKDVRQLVARLSAPRPQDRFASTDEAIIEIQRIQHARPAISSRILSSLGKRVEDLIKEQRQKPTATAASARLMELVELSREREAPAPPQIVFRESIARDVPEPPRTPPTSTAPPSRARAQSVPPPPAAIPNGDASNKRRTISVVGVVLVAVFLFIGLVGGRKVVTPAKPAAVLVTPPAVEPTAPTEIALTPREPGPEQLLWLEPTSIATFSWTKFLSPNEYEIQVARDADFRKLIVREDVSGTKFRPTQVLAEGDYYWRLVPHLAGNAPTQPIHFTVGALSAVELNEPDAEHVLTLPRAGKAEEIGFSWSAKPGVKRYRLQVSSTPEFQAPTLDLLVNGTQYTLARPPAAGEHYWRVRPEDMPQSTKYWSPGRQLSVRAAPMVQPKRKLELREPRLSAHHQTLTLNFRKPPRDVASIPNALAQAPELRWAAVPHAKSYLVQISKTKEFSAPLFEERVAGTRLNWRQVTLGRAYWRVAALGAGAERGAFSARGELDVVVAAPKLKKTYDFSGESADLKWPAAPLAEKYLVQVGRGRGVAGLEESVTSQPSLKVSGTGAFTVRVAAADQNGSAISPYSAPATISVQPAFAIAPPTLLQPNNGARASSVSGRISIVFSWSKVDDAESYILELASDAAFAQMIERRTTTDRGSLFRADIKGRVFWRVRARAPKGASDWSKTFHFDLK